VFIVKLILVPLWPFFIANYTMKKYNNGEFSLKGYVSTVFFLYCLMVFGAYQLLQAFTGTKPQVAADGNQSEPVAVEVGK